MIVVCSDGSGEGGRRKTTRRRRVEKEERRRKTLWSNLECTRQWRSLVDHEMEGDGIQCEKCFAAQLSVMLLCL